MVIAFSKTIVMVICLHLAFLGNAPAQVLNPQGNSQEPGQPQNGIATLPALILDQTGKPVTDLSQNELELYEGKEERPIVSINRTPEAPAEIGFLIDHSSSAKGALKSLEWKVDVDPARELLRDGDLGFVATFSQSQNLLCPPTPDLRQIKTALRTAFTTPFVGVTSLYDVIFWASEKEGSTKPGHKALLVISDMQDNTSEHTREEVVAQAQRLGISIYPIIPPGIPTDDPRVERVVKSLAIETGGVPYLVSARNDLASAFRNIRADLDNTYAVVYRVQSSHSNSVKVQCNRKKTRVIAPDRRF